MWFMPLQVPCLFHRPHWRMGCFHKEVNVNTLLMNSVWKKTSICHVTQHLLCHELRMHYRVQYLMSTMIKALHSLTHRTLPGALWSTIVIPSLQMRRLRFWAYSAWGPVSSWSRIQAQPDLSPNLHSCPWTRMLSDHVLLPHQRNLEVSGLVLDDKPFHKADFLEAQAVWGWRGAQHETDRLLSPRLNTALCLRAQHPRPGFARQQLQMRPCQLCFFDLSFLTFRVDTVSPVLQSWLEDFMG